MEYGDEYGELFGDAIATIETHTEDAANRLVYALSDAEQFKKLLAIFTERTQALENATRGVSPSMLFDIPTAYGVSLDQIGTIIGCPRQGWTDEQYRVYLSTQSLLILPDRRTQKRLIEVILSLLDGSPLAGVTYSEYRPKTFLVGISGTTIETLLTWGKFLERCRPITYNMLTKWVPDVPFVFDDDTATVVVTGEGFQDDSHTIDVGGHLAGYIIF